MNLLLTICAAMATFAINFVAWYMVGRRTLHVQRLDHRRACALVWWEDLLPYVGLGSFLLVSSVTERACVAYAGATGGYIGMWVAISIEKRRLAARAVSSSKESEK